MKCYQSVHTKNKNSPPSDIDDLIWFWLSYVCPLIVSLPMVFKYFCSDCSTWWKLFRKRIVRTKWFIILLLVLVEDQLLPNTNYRHPQAPEKVWTNFWKRHLWQVESWTTKLYVYAFDFKTWSEPINIYIKNMGGSRGRII